MSVVISAVPARVTYPLRRRVLRPHQRPHEVGFDADGDPRSRHFAAFDDEEVIGVVSVLPERPPWGSERPGWRLRGMATTPEHRREGVGRALVDALIAYIGEEGGGTLWCNARVDAVAFYRAAGFQVRGEPWEEPVIGPHIAMDRDV